MKQKESEENGAANSLRKETWIRPDGGRRLHRTTKALEEYLRDSEEEDLAALSSVEVWVFFGFYADWTELEMVF